VTTKKDWRPPEFIKGIKHNVEGFGGISKDINTRYELDSDGKIMQSTGVQLKSNQDAKYDDAIAGFKRRQKLRLSIPSLPDSEALNTEHQKAAVRRRMSTGRTGSMLSERESLG